MKNRAKEKRKLVVLLLFCGIAILTVYSCIAAPVLKETLITLISGIAAIAVFIQIKEGTEVSRAEFVMNLQESYTNSEGFSELFAKCWKNYNNEISYDEMYKYLNDDKKKEVLLNYLTFFESMYLMKEQGVLKLDILDELFGRRFFIVVNNKAIQDIDLVKNYRYYLNVVYLYEDWSRFRINRIAKKSNYIEEEEKKRLFMYFDDQQLVNNHVLSDKIKNNEL